MARAEQNQIVHAGLAPVQPVANVVAVQEAIVRAAWEAAATVSQVQRSPDGGWDRATAAANGQSSALVAGHRDINVTMGYKAVYPEEVINGHRAFIADFDGAGLDVQHVPGAVRLVAADVHRAEAGLGDGQIVVLSLGRCLGVVGGDMQYA